MANLFNSDFEIVRQFIAANVNNDWRTIEPYINDAEEKVLMVIGQEMWDKLQADLDANSQDADHLALLKLVRKAQANFGYLYYSSDGAVMVSDTGILQVDESGRKGAYQWQVREFKKSRTEKGWEALNQILKLMMANRDVYTQWSNNAIMEELLSVWLPTLESFTKQRRIADFETLWALRASMLFIQERILIDNISQGLYDEIQEQFLDDNLSAENKKLLNNYIAPVIAHLAIERASHELQFTLTSSGLRIDSTAAVSENSQTNTPAGSVDTFNVRQDAERKGKAALRELRQYLDATASASVYADYFNSDLYTTDTDNPTFTNNPNSGSFFAV